MPFIKIFPVLFSASLILAHPVKYRPNSEQIDGLLVRTVPKPVQVPPGGDFVSQARAKNNAPGRQVCKKLADCHCPNNPASKTGHSTSCINGICSCDNATINFFAGQYMDAVVAAGNAPITQAIGHLMQGLADVKEVVGVIAGAVLGPEAKIALKVALMAFPDTGPSHIDQATKGILTKML